MIFTWYFGLMLVPRREMMRLFLAVLVSSAFAFACSNTVEVQGPGDDENSCGACFPDEECIDGVCVSSNPPSTDDT